MSLKVITTDDIVKLDKQIKALKYRISIDTTIKDILIHKAALKELQEHREKILDLE